MDDRYKIQIPETFQNRPYAVKHFKEIVQYTSEHNPFYKRIYAKTNRVPIVDRKTFLKHNDEILNGNEYTSMTSGSTGIPVRISQSFERLIICQKDVKRFIGWLGGKLSSSKIIHPRQKPPPEDIINVKTPLDEQIAFLQRRFEKSGAIAVITYPTNGEMLARKIIVENIDMSFIKRFGVYSEAFESYQKDVIQKAFPKAHIWTNYSSIEFGIIAAQCPYEPNFHHIMSHKLGVEILDDFGLPCPEGVRGRVIITDYFNHQSPLIRYDIGDYAIRGKCPCGKIRLPALSRIIGKVRGALMHRNGQRVMFTELSLTLAKIDGMQQFQVIQETLENFIVKLVAERNIDAEIKAAFVKEFGYLPEKMENRYVKKIEREASGKYHIAICKVEDSYSASLS